MLASELYYKSKFSSTVLTSLITGEDGGPARSLPWGDPPWNGSLSVRQTSVGKIPEVALSKRAESHLRPAPSFENIAQSILPRTSA
jgi:hypothetical protein